MAEETKIIRIIVDSSKAVDGSAAATRALEKLSQQAGSMDATLARMEKGLTSIGTAVKAQLGLAIAELGARLVQMGRDAFAAASGLDELAEQLGTTAKHLQGAQFSAVQAGVGLNQLETGLGKFSQKMGEAADGSKEMIEALTALGVKNLDAQGKLRPTADLMQDVAQAIIGIEDPARRSAAAVDMFGKTGARLLPMMSDLAKGSDAMAAAAMRGGAFISPETIKRLDDFADKLERNKLKTRAVLAEASADSLEWLDKIDAAMQAGANGANAWLKRQISAVGEWLTPLVDQFNVTGVRAVAMFLEAFRQLPEQLGKLFTDGMNAAIGAVEWGLNAINRGIEAKAPWLGIKGNALTLPRLAGGGASFGDMGGQILAAGDAAEADMRARQATARAAADRRALINRQAGYETDEEAARIGGGPYAGAPGARTTAVKGGGGGEADRLAKLSRDGGRELEAATQYAAASERGARAVADLEIHFKALKAAQDAYGATADRNTGQVAALTVKIEEQMRSVERAKNLKDFNLGTEELEKANQLLAAENGLINANVETRARELAIIRLKQETQAKGLDEADPKERAAIERRGEAIAQNERLKAQGEELKKSSELWTEPLKNALNSIQSTAADMFDSMLERGAFSFQELGNFAQKMVRRMIAEFMALAVIRPMLGSLMGGLQGVGLVSPATASSLGYGSSGAGGGFSMPGMGGGSGMFGFLSEPITPMTYGGAPGGYDSIGQLISQGTPGALGGLTWGGALAGAAGIGMGAYNIATSKSTAGKIGGGLSILGSGIGMASAAGLLPMLGAAGGPIGMGLGMAGMLLPMLFGGGEAAPLPPLSGSNLRFDPGAGGYTMADTQQNGGASMAGTHGYIGSTLDSLFGAVGGLTDPSRAFGASVWNNQREGTTSTYLISPTQGSNQQTYNESGDPAKAIDRLIAKVFYDSVQNNAAMNAPVTLRTALGNKEPTSVAAVQALLSLVDAYDKLGKVTPSAKEALDQINAQFASLTAGANEYGLSLAPIQAEQKKLTTRYAQDFIDGMLDPMAVQLRELEDQRKDSIASAEYIRDNVKDVYVDMARIAEYWTRKELDLKEQAYAASVSSLQALIQRLTYGDLANASPDLSLSGTRGTYTATLAQARAGSSSALNSLAGTAEAYAGSARSYFGSSAEYAAIADQIRRDLEERVGATGGGGGAGGSANNEATNAVLQSNAELRAMVGDLATRLSAATEALAAAAAQMQRRA